jgi:hypothetical protein
MGLHMCVRACVRLHIYLHSTLCFGRGTFQKYLYVFHIHITLSIFKSVQDPFKWVEHKHYIHVQKKNYNAIGRVDYFMFSTTKVLVLTIDKQLFFPWFFNLSGMIHLLVSNENIVWTDNIL